MNETTITFLGNELAVSFYHATVRHAEKFTETTGGAFNLPVQSKVFTDAVFHVTETGQEPRLQLEGRHIILYSGQELVLVAVNDLVIGYIDRKSGNMDFTVSDLASYLRVGLHYAWPIGISVLAATLVYFLLEPERRPEAMLLAIGLPWLFYLVQKYVLSYFLRRAILRAVCQTDQLV